MIRASFPGTNQTHTISLVDSHLRNPRTAQTVIADDLLVTLEDEYSVELDDQRRVRISPTDVSQFVRLDRG